VGDTLLRLFGISSKTTNTGAFYKSSSSASDFALDDDDRSSVASTDSYGSDVTGSFWTTSPPVSSPGRSKSKSKTAQSSTSSSATTLRPTDALSLKILRLATKTDIQFLHQPRRNSHLLVLDLDHTLMDFSCRFDFMAEQLKRPYLDYFLSRAYQYYDIAVWSQTNFKWLELKLTELGMMDREDYKICFALDKSTMFTVKQQYVKPLKVIWHKCINQGWGPHNTVS
jgi:TFIIF-interacting CTD phosphatase-like protein